MNFCRRILIYSYSFFFCLRYLPMRVALKVPILIWPFGLRTGQLRRGQIRFSAPVRRAMVVLGFPETEGRDGRKSLLSVHKDGQLVFGDGVTLGRGTIVVVNSGQISFGNRFFCNADCFFNCNSSISIGDDCLMGWNIDCNTTDGHEVRLGETWREPTGPITIGSHVWVCSECHISKNVVLADGCVVAQRSLVNKSCLAPHTLLGGMPAREIRHGIEWRG